MALSDNLKEMEYVSKHGEAPYETTWPFTFNVLNDTVYVVDFGTKSMKKFHGGVFYGDFHFQMQMKTDLVSMIL